MRAWAAVAVAFASGCAPDPKGPVYACVPDDPSQCEVTVGGPTGGGDPCGPGATYMTFSSGDEGWSTCVDNPTSCEGCCPACECMSSVCEPGQMCRVLYDGLICTDEGECPDPVVFCDTAPPACEFGEYPEADPCERGTCPGRCWTGACLPCGSECGNGPEELGCVLVGRQGCCGPSGDCGGCTWAAPDTALLDDCYFEQPTCPAPDPPPGCATTCVDDPLCGDCPHCSPQEARCEGGYCVGGWPDCEPNCVCD